MMRANRSTLVKLCLLTALAVPVQRAASATIQASELGSSQLGRSQTGNASLLAQNRSSSDSPNLLLAQTFDFEAPASLEETDTLSIDGSSSMRSMNEALTEAFSARYGSAAVESAENGTDVALDRLLNGEIDLAAIGRPLTAAEEAAGLVAVPVAREKIAIFVSPDNEFSGDITFEEFGGIFRGEITEWEEVDDGSGSGALRFVDRPASSDTRQAFQPYPVFQTAPFETGATADPVAVDETEAVIEALGEDGIGYAIANQVMGNASVKIVPMHQTLPDNPAYPFSQPRNYVYSIEPSPAVAGFLAVATSPEGEGVIAEVRETEGAAAAQLDAPAESVTSADGALTARPDENNVAVIEDADGNLVAGPLAGAGGAVTALAFSPDGETLATGSNTGKVRYWGIDGEPKGEPFEAVVGADNAVTGLEFQSNDELLVSGSNGRVGLWGLNGLPLGEETAAAPAAAATAAASEASEGEFPWWLLWIPLLGLLGGVGWWLLGRSRRETALEPRRQTAPTATVPPPATDPDSDREVSNRAQTVISTDRVVDESRAVSATDTADIDAASAGLSSAREAGTASIGAEDISTAGLEESTDLESPDLEGTNLDLSTPDLNLGGAALGGAALGGAALGGAALGGAGLAAGLDASTETDDDDEEWDDNLDLTLDDASDELSAGDPIANNLASDDLASDDLASDDLASDDLASDELVSSNLVLDGSAANDSIADDADDSVTEVAEVTMPDVSSPDADLSETAASETALSDVTSEAAIAPPVMPSIESPVETASDDTEIAAAQMPLIDEASATETPVTASGTASVEESAVEESATEESAVEESATEESVTEESVTEESVTEESAVEESTDDDFWNTASVGVAAAGIGAAGIAAMSAQDSSTDESDDLFGAMTDSSAVDSETGSEIDLEIDSAADSDIASNAGSESAELESVDMPAEESSLSFGEALGLASDDDTGLENIEPTRDTVIAETDAVPDIEPDANTIIGDGTVIFGGAAASETDVAAASFGDRKTVALGSAGTEDSDDFADSGIMQSASAAVSENAAGSIAVGIAGGAATAVVLSSVETNESAESSGSMGEDSLESDRLESDSLDSLESNTAALGGIGIGGSSAAVGQRRSRTPEELADVDDGLYDLPDGYGESRIVLLPRDPKWAYAYWDVSYEHKQTLKDQGGQRLMLRLYDVTDIDQSAEAAHGMQQFDCDEMARSWYLEIPVSDRDYTAEIGYLTGDERWLVLARSAPMRVPPIYPSDWVKDQFVTIDFNERLAGKSFANLGRPGDKAAEEASVPDLPPIYDEIFAMTQGQNAMRVAGSLFGSMHQAPPGALNLSGVGLGAGAALNLSGLNMSGLNVSGLTMSGVGIGDRKRNFWLVAEAELIVYGATEPDATLTIGDQVVPLSPDGTFRFHVAFPDGQIDYPIKAVAADGEQSRSITMKFERGTPERNTNKKEEAHDEWF